VLKSGSVLDILTPILHHLNDARADQSRAGLTHIGVFILLLLSGERNFGVRLNKPYTAAVPLDVPVFSGTHADLLVIVFHKIVTTGHQRLQPLFDCLLTILCNVSPYVKSLSMIAAVKLLHLLEAFTTPWFLFSSPNNHHLVFFLLEIFNNIIQYQFDGNSNLVYSIIRKRQVFHHLANLPTDCGAINRTLTRRGKKQLPSTSTTSTRRESPKTSVSSASEMPVPATDAGPLEGSRPAQAAEPGTLKATLIDLPALDKMTEKEMAHPSQQQLDKLTKAGPAATLFSTGQNEEEKAEEEKPKEQQMPMVSESQATAAAAAALADLTKPSPPSVHVELQRSISRSSAGSNASSLAASMAGEPWLPTQEWVANWKAKLPLQTIMRLLQVSRIKFLTDYICGSGIGSASGKDLHRQGPD